MACESTFVALWCTHFTDLTPQLKWSCGDRSLMSVQRDVFAAFEGLGTLHVAEGWVRASPP